jgi:hypothetical protein
LTADRDSVRGAGMKRAERARKLLAEFKCSPNVPESVIKIFRPTTAILMTSIDD